MLLKSSFSYNCYKSEKNLPIIDQKLFRFCDNAIKDAYSIYSGFSVGASLLLENGKIYSANNQENSAFPSSMCAERVLLYNTRANYPKLAIKKIAISVKSIHGDLKKPVSPCGACRQVMVEYEQKQKFPIEILLKGGQGMIYVIKSAEDLLPLVFQPNLKTNE
tara:strand:- start:98 stop:586 length:489 start_codon:yes stop_codon:yes gene_type:complete